MTQATMESRFLLAPCSVFLLPRDIWLGERETSVLLNVLRTLMIRGDTWKSLRVPKAWKIICCQ